MRSSSDFFTLFSKPEYVWTTYHFFAMSISVSPPSSESRGSRPGGPAAVAPRGPARPRYSIL